MSILSTEYFRIRLEGLNFSNETSKFSTITISSRVAQPLARANSINMSVSRPARQFLSPPTFLCPRQLHHRPQRLFHATSFHAGRRKASKEPVEPVEAAKTEETRIDISSLHPYSEADKAMLAKKYTPKQLAAIEASETAIDPEDLLAQGVIRQDPGGLKYLDDLSKIEPVIDRQPEKPRANYDPRLRLKNQREIMHDLSGFVQSLDENDPNMIKKFMEFHDNIRVTVGKPEAELDPRTSLAPAIPRWSEEGKKMDEETASEFFNRTSGSNPIRPEMQQIMKDTGLSHRDLISLRRKVIVQHAVSNQTRMGKQRSWYVMTIVGDGKGMLGLGEGKALEPTPAMTQSFRLAVRNMKPIKRYERRTIYGEVKGKVGATELTLMARPPGECHFHSLESGQFY